MNFGSLCFLRNCSSSSNCQTCEHRVAGSNSLLSFYSYRNCRNILFHPDISNLGLLSSSVLLEVYQFYIFQRTRFCYVIHFLLTVLLLSISLISILYFLSSVSCRFILLFLVFSKKLKLLILHHFSFLIQAFSAINFLPTTILPVSHIYWYVVLSSHSILCILTLSVRLPLDDEKFRSSFSKRFQVRSSWVYTDIPSIQFRSVRSWQSLLS